MKAQKIKAINMFIRSNPKLIWYPIISLKIGKRILTNINASSIEKMEIINESRRNRIVSWLLVEPAIFRTPTSLTLVIARAIDVFI